jgi:hypothetical protein
MNMSWCNILTATQYRTQWRELTYKAVEKRKRQNENGQGHPALLAEKIL